MITYDFTGHVIRSDNEDCNVPIQVELNYDDERNPLAVQIILTDSHLERPVIWTVARDLFIQATNTSFPAGRGDVRLRACEAERCLYVRLRNEKIEQQVDIAFPLGHVRDFLAETTEAAAQSRPVIDAAIDRAIAEVLG